jgi:hypothetical protein
MIVLTFVIYKSTQLPLASTLECTMMVIFPLLEPIVEFMFSYTMVKKFLKILMDMMCGVLNIVPQNPTINVMVCKRTPNVSAYENHIIKNKLFVFLFHIMMVGGIALKVVFDRHKFWFCCDDLNCYVRSSKKKYAVHKPHVFIVWHVQTI